MTDKDKIAIYRPRSLLRASLIQKSFTKRNVERAIIDLTQGANDALNDIITTDSSDLRGTKRKREPRGEEQRPTKRWKGAMFEHKDIITVNSNDDKYDYKWVGFVDGFCSKSKKYKIKYSKECVDLRKESVLEKYNGKMDKHLQLLYDATDDIDRSDIDSEYECEQETDIELEDIDIEHKHKHRKKHKKKQKKQHFYWRKAKKHKKQKHTQGSKTEYKESDNVETSKALKGLIMHIMETEYHYNGLIVDIVPFKTKTNCMKHKYWKGYGAVFMNHPYSKSKMFIGALHKRIKENTTYSVIIAPTCHQRNYFEDFMLNYIDLSLNLKGFPFEGYQNQPPFPMTIYFFKPKKKPHSHGKGQQLHWSLKQWEAMENRKCYEAMVERTYVRMDNLIIE